MTGTWITLVTGTWITLVTGTWITLSASLRLDSLRSLGSALAEPALATRRGERVPLPAAPQQEPREQEPREQEPREMLWLPSRSSRSPTALLSSFGPYAKLPWRRRLRSGDDPCVRGRLHPGDRARQRTSRESLQSRPGVRVSLWRPTTPPSRRAGGCFREARWDRLPL